LAVAEIGEIVPAFEGRVRIEQGGKPVELKTLAYRHF
jgi:hypothetical protein